MITKEDAKGEVAKEANVTSLATSAIFLKKKKKSKSNHVMLL